MKSSRLYSLLCRLYHYIGFLITPLLFGCLVISLLINVCQRIQVVCQSADISSRTAKIARLEGKIRQLQEEKAKATPAIIRDSKVETKMADAMNSMKDELASLKNRLNTREQEKERYDNYFKQGDLGYLEGLARYVRKNNNEKPFEFKLSRVFEEQDFRMVLDEKIFSCNETYTSSSWGSQIRIDVSCDYKVQYCLDRSCCMTVSREGQNIIRFRISPRIICTRIASTFVTHEDEGYWNTITEADRKKAENQLDEKARHQAAKEPAVWNSGMLRFTHLMNLTPTSIDENYRWQQPEE